MQNNCKGSLRWVVEFESVLSVLSCVHNVYNTVSDTRLTNKTGKQTTKNDLSNVVSQLRMYRTYYFPPQVNFLPHTILTNILVPYCIYVHVWTTWTWHIKHDAENQLKFLQTGLCPHLSVHVSPFPVCRIVPWLLFTNLFLHLNFFLLNLCSLVNT